MSAFLSSTKNRVLAGLFAIAAAVAMIAAVAPVSAYAVEIPIYSGAGTSTSDLIATIDTDNLHEDVAFNAGSVKGQYYKSGCWHVVGGMNYLTLDTLLTSYVPTQWGSASYVTFDTSDHPEGYTRFNSDGHFAKSLLTSTYYFYGSTLYDSPVSALPTPYTASYRAVLAFSWGSSAQADGVTADNTTISYNAYTYPRLIWGLNSASPTYYMGNRFPQNITAIHIY